MLTHKPTHNEYTPINPKPFFATIANAQPSIHAANRISKLFAAFVQIAYPLILLARENRGQLSYSLSIHQSNLFSHFSVYSARPCNRWRCCLTPSCTTNSSPMGKREKLACFRAMLASCPFPHRFQPVISAFLFFLRCESGSLLCEAAPHYCHQPSRASCVDPKIELFPSLL